MPVPVPAVTIEASPGQVWPWLVQMGWGRGGWCSWDAHRVGILEPNRFLGLYGYTDWRGRWLDPGEGRPAACVEAIREFQLKELPGGRTRLVIGGYRTFRPRWIEGFVTPGCSSSSSGPCRAA